MPRVPAIPSDTFLAWADARWTRLPSPPGGGFEAGRWVGAIDNRACVIIAYRCKRRNALRLAVQGVGRDRTRDLTAAVYAAYFAECGRRGADIPRPLTKPQRHNGGHGNGGR